MTSQRAVRNQNDDGASNTRGTTRSGRADGLCGSAPAAFSAALVLLAMAGCDPGTALEHPEDQATEESAVMNSKVAPGDVAEGCSEEGRTTEGQAIEVCSPEALQPDALQDRPAEEASSKAPGATGTTLAASAALSASTAGAKVTATVVWTSASTFELRDVKLSDTQCDGKQVFFHAIIPGFQYPNHFNKSGCNTTSTWSKLKGSSSNIHAVWLEVCRDKTIDNCSQSKSSVNPYSR